MLKTKRSTMVAPRTKSREAVEEDFDKDEAVDLDAAAKMKGQLVTVSAVKEFMTAGRARISLKSKVTGSHFTYRVSRIKNETNLYFVNLLNGPDNESNFEYLGKLTVTPEKAFEFTRGFRSRITADSPSYKAFMFMIWFMAYKECLPKTMEVWHEGRCGRCSRVLTVPTSIARGIGPECWSKMEVF
jgi:hypothetical protein